jgi:hypothetical protein
MSIQPIPFTASTDAVVTVSSRTDALKAWWNDKLSTHNLLRSIFTHWKTDATRSYMKEGARKNDVLLFMKNVADFLYLNKDDRNEKCNLFKNDLEKIINTAEFKDSFIDFIREAVGILGPEVLTPLFTVATDGVNDGQGYASLSPMAFLIVRDGGPELKHFVFECMSNLPREQKYKDMLDEFRKKLYPYESPGLSTHGGKVSTDQSRCKAALLWWDLNTKQIGEIFPREDGESIFYSKLIHESPDLLFFILEFITVDEFMDTFKKTSGKSSPRLFHTKSAQAPHGLHSPRLAHI